MAYIQSAVRRETQPVAVVVRLGGWCIPNPESVDDATQRVDSPAKQEY